MDEPDTNSKTHLNRRSNVQQILNFSKLLIIGKAASLPLAAFSRTGPNRLYSSFQVDPVGNLGQNRIRVFLFGFDRLQYRGIFFQSENLGPPAQSAINRDF